MGPFGKKRIVVKKYEADGLLIGAIKAPVTAPLAIATLGRHGGNPDRNRLFERDAQHMARQGYRVASVNDQGHSVFGGKKLIVTYELVDHPKQPKGAERVVVLQAPAPADPAAANPASASSSIGGAFMEGFRRGRRAK
jgi:hypothetical protein